MNVLKAQIRAYELQIKAKETLAYEQYQLLKLTIHEKITTPTALGVSFLLGFLIVYTKHRKPVKRRGKKLTNLLNFGLMTLHYTEKFL